ncbi:MAG TPA: ankyrin repeat domain-containing protein [Polyangia bacterium]|jgi:ankyrin repeat protein|nr:ankyrin repeat domain-containing protein [Polyangia bacterium]
MNHRCSISLLVLAVVGCATMPKADQDLFAAVKADNAGGVERAVATGANVNGKHVGRYVGASALGWAGVWGSMNSAEWLIAHGADVNGANEHGSTPLHLAAYNLQLAVAGLLIRHGAAVNARSEVGWTPLHKAMERLAEAPGTRTPADEEVAKATRIVELLLASGADVNIRGVQGISPLHVAAGTGQERLVQLLVDRGADAKGASVDGVTPLVLAAGRDVGEVAALLIAQGGDVNARTKRGFTALTVAAGNGNPAVAKVLVEHGADIGLRDKDGFTALLSACRSLLFEYTLRASTPGAQDLRRKLLGRAGARSVTKDREEHRRARGDFSAVAILLLEHGADPTDGLGDFLPLQTAALVGDKALAEAAIARGAAINRLSRDGTELPLHAAIAEGHRDVARLLIDKGADVNAPNMSGFTPLHFLAVFTHDGQLAELLIRQGANVNATDQRGHTPLEGAVRAGNHEVVEVLRHHGAR